MLENAKGFAIFTIFKAGFLFSARAGSGVVIARLQDGSEYIPVSSVTLQFEGSDQDVSLPRTSTHNANARQPMVMVFALPIPARR